MASEALRSWQADRKDRLDELFAAHEKTGGVGKGPGRRRNTEQLNWALILKLAAEFQGFARDLHDTCSDQFSTWIAPTNGHARDTIRATLVSRRLLDQGNAHADALRYDFGRFGIDFWAEMRRVSKHNGTRGEHLNWLQKARNAIAHDDGEKFRELAANGYKLGLADARRWHKALNGLAGDMDSVLSRHLASLFAMARPW